MLVTTHTVIAATVAIKTGNPYLYFPFAAADHFAFDTMPHFGGDWVNKNLKLVTALDAIVGISIFLAIAFFTHSKFSVLILFAVCLLAGWPDLIWLTKRKHFPKFKKWHAGIQKFETSPGIILEIAVVLFCLLLIFVF